MKRLKRINETVYPSNDVNARGYIYAYKVKDVIKYIGQGTDGNKSGKTFLKRARDIESHNSQCISNYNNITVEVIQWVYTTNSNISLKEKLSGIEAAYIKSMNLVEDGWNKREELSNNKYFSHLEMMAGEKEFTADDLINLALEGAEGAAVAEPEILAKKLVGSIDELKSNTLLIGNETYGIVNTAVELQNKFKGKRMEINTTRDANQVLNNAGAFDEGTLIPSTANFLETNFTKKYDTIIMNPPWSDLGTQFVDKANSVLKPGGTLIVITSYEGFTKIPNKSIKKGSFLDLQNKGHFEIIDTYSVKTNRDCFGGKNNWLWFKWIKGAKKGSTQIINRLGEEFTFTLLGNEFYVPQLENESDFFDWDSGKPAKKIGSKGNENYYRFLFKILKEGAITWEVQPGDENPTQGALYSWLSAKDENKIKSILNNGIDWNTLYANRTGFLRMPPLRKDLFGKS